MKQLERKELINKKVKEFYTGKLGFCLCSNPDTTLSFIKDLLNLIDNTTKNHNNENYEIDCDNYQKDILNTFGFKDESKENLFTVNQCGIFHFIFYYLDKIGVLRHKGCSIGGAWLSEYGKEILGYLNELSDEDIENFFN